MANYYLLYNDATSVTGKELGQWLKDQGLDIDFGKTPGDHKYHGVVRWGSTGKLGRKPDKVLNWQSSIELSSDKLKSLTTLAEADIRVPTVYSLDARNITFPVMGRAIQHVGGTDICLCLQPQDIQMAKKRGCEYLTGYIPADREFGVHVFNDQVIKISEKVLTEDEKWQPHIRNLSTGYTFRVPQERPPTKVRYEALAAVEALRLHFGRVDVILGADGHSYVLEVNTAPGLTVDTSIEAYGTKILAEFA